MEYQLVNQNGHIDISQNNETGSSGIFSPVDIHTFFYFNSRNHIVSKILFEIQIRPIGPLLV